MIITVTYKTSQQISPDDWTSITKVIHLKDTDTFLDAYSKITQGWKFPPTDSLDVELHFNFKQALQEK